MGRAWVKVSRDILRTLYDQQYSACILGLCLLSLISSGCGLNMLIGHDFASQFEFNASVSNNQLRNETTTSDNITMLSGVAQLVEHGARVVGSRGTSK